MKKRIVLPALLSAFLAFPTMIPVSAMTLDQEQTDVIQMSTDGMEIVEETLNGMTRSTSLPTSGLDLSKQSYKANIERATRNWLYTNVYFKVSSSRAIRISYSFSSNNGDPARIAVYDMTTGTWVAETTGLSGGFQVANLNTSHKYAVAFCGYQSGFGTTVITGSATITG